MQPIAERIPSVRQTPGLAASSAMAVVLAACVSHRARGDDVHWVGTWASAPQRVEAGNLPPAPGLSDGTLRQIVCLSIGGSRVRVRLSNAYGDGPVTLTSVHLAASVQASTIDPATDASLTFAGSPSVTIEPGGAVSSDPLAYAVHPLSTMAVTLVFGRVPAAVTGHPGSRTTSYLVPGRAVAAESLPSAVTAPHWYFLSGIDVAAEPSSAAIVALGDSITDGRGATLDRNNRWTDDLSRRLQADPATRGVAVLNLGIGGNAVLGGGLGPPALQRFPSDVLNRSGARWVVLFEGVNDIGASATPDVASELISAFGRLIDMGHGHGLLVYGASILPFGGSAYWSPEHEQARQTVNRWIRSSGRFDAVIDFDAAARDPNAPARLRPAYDSGDGLHPSPAGYQAIADAVDLSLFRR